MSYILEALQKSEHARQRGKVPDLSTLPEPTSDVPDHAAARRPPYVAAIFALTLAAAVLGWWRPWQAAESQPSSPAAATKAADDPRPLAPASEPAPQPVATAPQEKPTDTSPTAAAPSPAASPAVPPPVTAAAPAAPVAPPTLNPLTPVRPPVAAAEPPSSPVARARRETSAPEAPPPAAEAARTRRSEPSPKKTAEASPPASPPSVPAATPPAPAPVRAATAPDNAAEASTPANRKPDGRILSIHELPPAIRSSLPRLSISGVAAAPNAGKSWALINDRLVQEGDEVEPGITLTSAAKDGVVLDYKGYRFRAQQ